MQGWGSAEALETLGALRIRASLPLLSSFWWQGPASAREQQGSFCPHWALLSHGCTKSYSVILRGPNPALRVNPTTLNLEGGEGEGYKSRAAGGFDASLTLGVCIAYYSKTGVLFCTEHLLPLIFPLAVLLRK